MRDLQDYQRHYENQPFERYQVHYRKKKIKEILLRYNHDFILEVGCGLDSILNDFTSFKKLFVVEPAGLFYEKAQKDRICSDRREDIVILNKYIEAGIKELSSLELDFVVVSCLLHEIQDQANFLNAIKTISTVDTVTHISVPNAKSFHRLLAVEMGLIESIFEKSTSNEVFQQNTNFSLESLITVVEDSGFTVVESGTYSFKPFTHQQMADMLGAGLLTERMLDGFYKMEKYLPQIGSEIFINVRKNT